MTVLCWFPPDVPWPRASVRILGAKQEFCLSDRVTHRLSKMSRGGGLQAASTAVGVLDGILCKRAAGFEHEESGSRATKAKQ